VLKYYIQLNGAENVTSTQETKAREIAELINSHLGREHILVQMSKASPKVLSENLLLLDLEQMKAMLSVQFS